MVQHISLCDLCTPKQWPTLSLKELSGGDFPVYGANGIIGYHDTYNHEEPTVMIGCRGSCGHVAISRKKSYINGNAMCLDNLSADIIEKFLFYYLENYDFSQIITGSSQPQITRESLKKVQVPVISKDLQAEVVAVFDNISTLIDARTQQLSKMDELVKARFVELFGDPVVNEKGWATKPLLEMGSCKNGMNFHYEDTGVEINCLGVGDFKDYSIISDTSILPTVSLNEMPSSDYILQDDDIVFVRSNGNKALVGRSVAVYPGKVPTTFSGFCIRYRKTDETVNIPYLLRVLKAESVRQKMAGRGANIQNLNQQILGTLIIPVPPIELQNQFAAFVEQTDKSKVVIQKSLDELETLKKALMQKYFG